MFMEPGLRLWGIVAVVAASTAAFGGTGTDETATTVAPSTIAGALPPETTTPAARKKVVVSDPANTALVREIAGDLLEVESIVPPGANGHTYEPVPADAVRAASADLYIENGRGLNDSVTKFVRTNARPGTPEVTLADAIPDDEVISTDSAEQIAAHGHAHSYNAHFWTDPVYAIDYIEEIAAALSALDPVNAATYSQRAAAFTERLRALDGFFRAAIASIPERSRKLVVYHDSWSYFGRRYGIPVVGAIQPVSFSEPSADEIRRMIDQIRAEAVPAFFGSEVFPSDVLNAIASETGAAYYSDLSDEELPGEPGSPEHSYVGMMIGNVRLITSALGGDPSILDALGLNGGGS
jgi:ABC-type Zn uptake system ZnuABC Zn-binding protein ZnuA